MTTNYDAIKSLRAQIKNMQSDLFFELKTAIQIYSKDMQLNRIINQPYYFINNNKSVPGIDGKKCYGVVDSYDPNKRNRIVKEVVKHLLISRESAIWCHFSALANAYFCSVSGIEAMTSVSALKKRLLDMQDIVIDARNKREHKRLSLLKKALRKPLN